MNSKGPSTPPVTLVMPSYRRGRLIERTLRSVENQTRRPDETIVVNDGGWPETTEFVQENFPWVTVMNVPHGGAAKARNAGVEACRSDLVMLFDDDDELLPHAVETLVTIFQRFPEAHAAYTDHTFTDLHNGKHHQNHHYELPWFVRLHNVSPVRVDGDTRLYDSRLYLALIKGNLLQQPWMCRRETYLAVGGFRSDLGSADDWDLYMRLTSRYQVAVSDAVISNHFVEPGRPHLTKLKGQAERNVAILRRRLQDAPPWRWHEQALLRRQIAVYYKKFGDEVREDRLTALKYYQRSLAMWPFDHVVAARTFAWNMQRLVPTPRADHS